MASAKPYVILLLGTISLIGALLKLFGLLQADWIWIALPLWAPVAYAYVSFIVILIHALGTGKLTVVNRPPAQEVPVEPKSDGPKIDLTKPKGPLAPPSA